MFFQKCGEGKLLPQSKSLLHHSLHAYFITRIPISSLFHYTILLITIISVVIQFVANSLMPTGTHFHIPCVVSSFKLYLEVKTEGNLVISGTMGYAYVPAPWWKTDHFEFRFEDQNQKRSASTSGMVRVFVTRSASSSPVSSTTSSALPSFVVANSLS